VSDNFHSCFFIPDLCGCRLCASDMSGLMRLLIYASVGLFSVYDVFSGHFCTFLCSLPVLHCTRSRSGGVRCVVFLQTRSCFCSVFFLSPPSCGGAVGGVPSGGDLHPTDKSRWPFTATQTSSFLQRHFLCVVLSLSLVLWVPVLSS
jgi:hypothetical protein